MANAQQRNVDEFQLPKGGLIKKLMYIMAFIGPASMLCSTSMGPGTASSCIQAGSMFGYDLLWAIVLSGIMCGGVAYIGAKATALSGKDVFELIRERIGNVACSILFVVVLITWYMVIYSQGSIMRHLNDIMFGEQAAAVAYVVTILLIAYLYYASTNNRIIKMASIMCTVMAIIFFINVFYVRPNIGQLIGGMVPPCAIALATLLFKNKFTKQERESGPVNFIMGLAFITEGAIPFAASDPLHVLPSCIAGSALAGALSMAFGCTLMAPHGGIFVFPVVTNPLMYLAALVIGTAVGALLLGVLKKRVRE